MGRVPCAVAAEDDCLLRGEELHQVGELRAAGWDSTQHRDAAPSRGANLFQKFAVENGGCLNAPRLGNGQISSCCAFAKRKHNFDILNKRGCEEHDGNYFDIF